MIWELLGGIVFILLSVVLLKIFLDSHRVDREVACVGVIKRADAYNGEIIVEYKINGKKYSAPFDCKTYARVGEMPPVGLKVMVIADSDAPEEIYVKFSRGNRNGHQYVNFEPNKDFRTKIGCTLLIFLMGVHYIFEALGWI